MKNILIAAALLVGTPAYPQDQAAEIDKIFSWSKPTDPGCAVAVSKDGKQVVNRAYGLADLERNVPLSPETLFDAGSIRKQFVAASIFLLAEEGRLAPSDDVHKFIKELPDYGHMITLDHLLTHTSGIRDWVGLLTLADGDVDAWSMILRQRGLNFAPGEELSYSNSNYVLLTEIVARVSGMPFSEFAKKRLFEPLGMKATIYVTDMKDVITNRALAYEKDKQGRWKHDMLLGNDRGGAGVLFTTPSDLLLWNEALTSKRLGAFVTEKLEEPAKLNNGRTVTTFGRGLFINSFGGAKEYWYTGSSAAYKGWSSRHPAQGLSIAILCNSGDSSNRPQYAERLFKLFAPNAPHDATEGGPPPEVVGEALADVNSRAGLFFNEKTGEAVRLSVDRNRFRIAGGPGMVPLAKDRYRRWGVTAQYMSEDRFELNFLSPDQFEWKSMEGTLTKFRRAVPYAPTDADLKALAGDYASDELKAVVHMAQGKAGLMGRINETPGEGYGFTPVERDTFQLGMLTIRFRRDKAGNVLGLDFSNPVVSNIKFTRISESNGGS